MPDVEKFKAIEKALFECRVHKWEGSLEKAKEVAKANIQLASRLHMNNAVIEFSSVLKLYYSAIKPNKKHRDRYQGLFDRFAEIRANEEDAERLFADFNFYGKKKKSVEFQSCIIEGFHKVLERPLSFRAAIRAYYSLALYYLHIGQDEKVIKLSGDGIQYLNNLSFTSTIGIQRLTFVALPVYIKQKEFSKAAQIIDIALPKNRDLNYYNLCKWKVICYFHWGKWDLAQTFVSSISTKGMVAQIREPWEVYKAYCAVLGELNLTTPTKYRFSKLKNDIELFESDKTGYYYNVVIIEILHLFATDKQRLIDREGAIKRYMFRHSKAGSRFRVLIAGLVKWINSSFQHDLTTLLLELEKTKPYPVDLEILPYARIIELLRANSGHSAFKQI